MDIGWWTFEEYHNTYAYKTCDRTHIPLESARVIDEVKLAISSKIGYASTNKFLYKTKRI